MWYKLNYFHLLNVNLIGQQSLLPAGLSGSNLYPWQHFSQLLSPFYFSQYGTNLLHSSLELFRIYFEKAPRSF